MAGVTQLVESLPSKQVVASSSLVSRSIASGLAATTSETWVLSPEPKIAGCSPPKYLASKDSHYPSFPVKANTVTDAHFIESGTGIDILPETES